MTLVLVGTMAHPMWAPAVADLLGQEHDVVIVGRDMVPTAIAPGPVCAPTFLADALRAMPAAQKGKRERKRLAMARKRARRAARMS